MTTLALSLLPSKRDPRNYASIEPTQYAMTIKRTRLSRTDIFYNDDIGGSPSPYSPDRAFTSSPTVEAETSNVRQVPATVTNRKARKNRKLPDLPWEVLRLVFALLQPQELINLSRTTASIRSFLFGGGSRSIWSGALAMVPELPPCPNDMNAVAYVHLAFDTCCYGCGKRNKPKVFWILRMKLCKKCLENRIQSNDLVVEQDPKSSQKYPLLSACDWNLVAYDWDWSSGYRRSLALPTHCVTAEAHLKVLQDTQVKHKTTVTHLVEEASRARLHAERCRRWHNHRKSDRREELNEAHERRQKAVMNRLHASGYGQMTRWLQQYAPHQDRRDFEALKVFKDLKALTDRMWSNAKPIVEGFLEARRDAYNQTRWDYTINFRMRLLNIVAGSFFDHEDALHTPRASDLLSIPIIRATVEKPMGNDHEPDDFHPDRIMGILQTFNPKTLSDTCNQHRRTLLVQMACSYLNSETSLATRHIDPSHCLDLAITVFQCHSSKFAFCGAGYMSSEETLVHRCRIIDIRQPSWDHDQDPCVWAENTYLKQMERSSLYADHHRDPYGKVAISPTGSRAIWNLVKRAGADPHTATSAYMDKLDPWFSCECNHCLLALIRGSKLVFDWRHAIGHAPMAPKAKLANVETKQARECRQLSRIFLPSPNIASYRDSMAWTCAHCEKDPLTTGELEMHLMNRHPYMFLSTTAL